MWDPMNIYLYRIQSNLPSSLFWGLLPQKAGSCKENYIRDPVGSIEKLVVRGVCVLNLCLVYTVQ